jgi:hypothetical protein
LSAPAPAAATLRERFAAQLLVGAPARAALQVTERLLAIQGQDPRGARLAIRARSSGLSAADVDRALTEERSLLITWLNRGTLHLVRSEDYTWLHALTAPPLRTALARRLSQEGVTPAAAERAVQTIERALAAEGALTRHELRARIAAGGVRTEGQALVHILGLAANRGLIARGPMIGGEHAWVLVRDWLAGSGALPRGGPPPRERALAELARRYLAGHGPADARDLAKWAGLPLRDARAGLAAIAGELHERSDGTVALTPADAAPRLPRPRLLGAFDPVLLGWSSRAPLVGKHQGLITVNGLFRPFALVTGRAAALWRLQSGAVALEPLEELGARQLTALRREARDVVRFLGRADAHA